MTRKRNYDPDSLEVAVFPSGPKSGKAAQWKWAVCEKGKAPIRSGIVTGAESGAWAKGNEVLMELIAEAEAARDE